MKLVDRAEYEPAKCLVSGSWAEPRSPLIDFESWSPVTDPRIYLAPSVVAEAASKLLGMIDGEEYARVAEKLEEARTRADELEKENNELSRAFDAIDVIESRDFRARKKTGRKTKEQEMANA